MPTIPNKDKWAALLAEKSIVNPETGCREWTGYVNSGGYGVTTLGRAGTSHTVLVHRLAYELAYGEIPPGMCVCHKCDNRRCINPEHHFLGTKTDNNYDRTAKGRTACGERSGRAKLTWKQVEAIRQEYTTSKISINALAKKYGVSRCAIWRITSGNGWNRKSGKEDNGKI